MSGYAFLGTSELAAAVLLGACERGLYPALVVTPPDRRRGRGRRLAECEAATAASELGIPVLKIEDANAPAARAEIATAADGLALLCEFGQMIGAELLEALLVLNVHPSLLPRWRGAAPIERAIMAGDDRTGTCIMRLEAGLDSGPIAACESTVIGDRETFGQMRTRLGEIGARLAVDCLEAAREGTLELRPQAEVGITYAHKIEKSERRLDPAEPAVALERKVRALYPHIGAYVQLEGGERLGVEAARVIDAGALATDAGHLEIREGEIAMQCGKGMLALEQVKPSGGRSMEAAELLRGRGLPGERAV